jgi:endonuclease/exonuclease/phosphatase family metal-dependent hydrolase
MSKPVRRILVTLGVIGILLVLSFAGLVVFLSVTEFSPNGKQVPVTGGKGTPLDPGRREFSFLTWNIGYAGLGRDMDFFYDGGKRVIPSEEQCNRYLAGIKKFIVSADSSDFIFLQEVDIRSKRSWELNEFKTLSEALPGFSNAFAPNYRCRYVPSPLREPMGAVESGIACFSRPAPAGAVVQYFNSAVSWPKRLVYLKRCYLLIRFSLDNGKDLVVINTHNSAYDSTGEMRKSELATLDSVMMAEYRRGNYVVAGGDWNSNPAGFKASAVTSGDAAVVIEPEIGPSFVPGWQFVFDPSTPSNRYVDIPYTKGITRTTIIDFFVVSPNVEVTRIETIPAGFAFSDHQPVRMGVRLR